MPTSLRTCDFVLTNVKGEAASDADYFEATQAEFARHVGIEYADSSVITRFLVSLGIVTTCDYTRRLKRKRGAKVYRYPRRLNISLLGTPVIDKPHTNQSEQLCIS